MSLLLTGGRVIDPANGVDAVMDILVQDGLIAQIGDLRTKVQAERELDVSDKLVIPGVVDLCARLREPGFEYRGTLESELTAAMSAGITSLVLPPDTDPCLDEPGLVEMLRHRTRQFGQVRVFPLAAMTVGLKGKNITEMGQLTEAGCVGFSQADQPIEDSNVLLRAMQYARSFGHVLWLRPQDFWLSGSGVAASGPYASRLGLAGIPEQAETVALHTFFELQRATGVRLHICRLSSGAGVELVRQAKASGLPVTCDVSINNLHLTDWDIGFYDSRCRLEPPLRHQNDLAALRQGLADGTIDAVCSDHTPVDEDDKQKPFAEAEVGATGLELLLSLTLKWAQDDKLDLSKAIARLTNGPAQVLHQSGLQAPVLGSLAVGSAADLAVVDLKDHWIVGQQTIRSQSWYTPFEGWEIPARVSATVARGHLVWERDA